MHSYALLNSIADLGCKCVKIALTKICKRIMCQKWFEAVCAAAGNYLAAKQRNWSYFCRQRFCHDWMKNSLWYTLITTNDLALGIVEDAGDPGPAPSTTYRDLKEKLQPKFMVTPTELFAPSSIQPGYESSGKDLKQLHKNIDGTLNELECYRAIFNGRRFCLLSVIQWLEREDLVMWRKLPRNCAGRLFFLKVLTTVEVYMLCYWQFIGPIVFPCLDFFLQSIADGCLRGVRPLR